MDLKIDANKFRGSLQMDYKIETKTEGCLVCLSLFVKTPLSKEYEYYGSATGIFNDEEESSSVGLTKAIQKAYDKWGIYLIKEKIKEVA